MTSIYSKLIDFLTQRQIALQMTEDLLLENREDTLAIERIIDGYQAKLISLRKEYMQHLQASVEPNEGELVIKQKLSAQIEEMQNKLAAGKQVLKKNNDRHLQLQNRRNQLEVQVHHIEKRCHLLQKENRDNLQKESRDNLKVA